jgi:hypothetical protein
MAQVTAIINRIVMDENYHVSFYNQFGYVAQVLETDVFVEISGDYLVCGSNGDSIRFFANTVTSIETPTLSQSYTPITAGFYQQGSQYFERLTELYDFINTNIVSVVIRNITALKFADGTTQTTAATGGGGSGTVTSVGFTEGTGIDITGTNPITTSGTVTITNTAPDQVVTLGEGTGIDVTGTYPNFTITNTAPDQTVSIADGTGIDVTGTYPNFTVTNTAPDQTVVLNNGTGISVSGTYPSFTITNTAPSTGSGIPHGTASGTDTYTTTITGVTAYNDADAYLIRFTIGNTTSATLNINSLGAVPLYRNNDGELIGGDIIDGAEMLCVYNSTTNRFQVIGTAPNTLLAYVTNAETTTITKGQPVYAFGGQGDRLKVKLAYNAGDSTSAQTIGFVLSTSIAANQKGLIIVNGQLDGLNIFPTSTWADSDPVYLGATPGSVTNVKPLAPNHLVYLGVVTTANNGSAGRMYVRVQNGYELYELHDVQVGSYGTKDVLWRDTTSSPNLWKNVDVFTLMGAASSSANGYLTSTDWSTFNSKGSGTVTSVSALTLGTTGTDLSSSVATGTTTPVITLNVPTASATNRGALSSVDWSKFNGKQNAITLTTTGTSGPATFSGDTLNIPQYSGGSSTSKSFLVTFLDNAINASTTVYITFGSATFLAVEANRLTVAPADSTFSKFYVKIYTSQSGTGSLVFTLRKNQVDTAVVTTIAAGSAGGTEANSGANSVAFTAGDDISIKAVNNATATSGRVMNLSCQVEI